MRKRGGILDPSARTPGARKAPRSTTERKRATTGEDQRARFFVQGAGAAAGKGKAPRPLNSPIMCGQYKKEPRV